MSNKMLYLDESGETGTERFSGTWNFAKQPYFALCGVLIDADKVNEFNKYIESLRQLYKIQGEIKASKEVVRKNKDDIIEKIWNKQKEFACKIYIEIVNKKFCIAMKITDYCVLPYYDVSDEMYNSDEAVFIRKNFANYICESISDELLGEFTEFFDNNTQNILELKLLCEKLIKNINNGVIIEYVKETIDSIENYNRLNLEKHNLFPLVDYYKGERSSVAISPHIDSFNNILNRIGHENYLVIVHDKSNGLEDALRQIVSERDFEDNNMKKIQFEDSKQVHKVLQIADFWCGTINSIVQRILHGEKNLNSIIEEILQTRVNFVSTFKEQRILFPNNEMIKCFDIWYRDYFNK